MDGKESADGRRQLLQAVLELETKALNYLLVANGAGLAGCLAALKDYATVPQLKGVGMCIALFSAGLVFAAIAFVFFQRGSFEVMKHVTIGDENPRRGQLTMTIMNYSSAFSGTCFIFAILMIARKLSGL